MRSTFTGLEIARTGLSMGQLGLDLTGHNIANVDTAGYTRQRIVGTAVDPTATLTQYKKITSGLVGGGTKVLILDQIRSAFLDRQFRTEQSQQAYYQTKTTGLTYVESLFESTDGSSLAQGIVDLFEALNTLATEANDKAQRTVVKNAAQSLCSSFNQVYDRLIELQGNQNSAVETVVGQINSIADSIAMLNKSIYSYELNSGEIANDLRDKRNLLLDELSALVDINYYETADNKLVVQVDGKDIVNHITTTKLTTQQQLEPISGAMYSVVCWNANDAGTIISSGKLGGELAAHLDLRDSTNPSSPGIAYFIDQLNIMARAIVQAVNAQQNAGYTHSSSSSGSITGFDAVGPAITLSGNTGLANAASTNISEIILTAGNAISDSLNLTSFSAGDLTVASTAGDGTDAVFSLTVNGRTFESAEFDLTGITEAGEYTVTLTDTNDPTATITLTLTATDAFAGFTDFENDVSGISGSLDGGDPGVENNFFEVPGGDINNVNAGNFSVDQDIINDVYNIAASSVFVGDDQEGNQENARLLYELLNLNNIVLDLGGGDTKNIGGLYNFMSSIVLDVATSLKLVKDYNTNHSTLLLSIDTQRTSVSGVSLDEEMTNLIKYQHAYNGASRVITAMDEALEVLINKMGLVGRS